MLGVIERLGVVQAHDAADHRAAVFVLGQPVHRAAQVQRGEQLGVDRQHAARLVQGVDRLPVARVLRPAHAEAAEHPLRRAVVGEPQAQGVGRVEEQLLGGLGQHLLRCGHVQGDVAFARVLVEQILGQGSRVGVGVAYQQPAPAAVHGTRLVVGLAAVAGQARLQALVGRRLAAQQALAVGDFVGFHRSDSLFAQPQVERCQLPQLGATQRGQLAVRVAQ
ncbi:hypothetical protein D3C79_601140 [compost metagenome]